MHSEITTDQTLVAISSECGRARRLNHSMVNLHEAYGIIAEEFAEFEEEVFKNPRKHPERNSLARKELIQLGAMCLRAIVDLQLQEDVLKTHVSSPIDDFFAAVEKYEKSNPVHCSESVNWPDVKLSMSKVFKRP